MPGSQLAGLRFFHVIAKLIFSVFQRRAVIPANRASPPHVIGPEESLLACYSHVNGPLHAYTWVEMESMCSILLSKERNRKSSTLNTSMGDGMGGNGKFPICVPVLTVFPPIPSTPSPALFGVPIFSLTSGKSHALSPQFPSPHPFPALPLFNNTLSHLQWFLSIRVVSRLVSGTILP